MNLKERWIAGGITIRKAAPEDTDRLKEICDSWKNKQELEGEEFPENYIETCLNGEDLPPAPDADKSKYYFMVMEDSKGELAGFFDVYHGYPDKDTLWISMFMIDKDKQGNSYGKAVIESLGSQGREAGYKSLGLAVYLKNWKGLRFWNKNGFDKILGIYGDKEYGVDAFSIMGLKKELSYQD